MKCAWARHSGERHSQRFGYLVVADHQHTDIDQNKTLLELSMKRRKGSQNKTLSTTQYLYSRLFFVALCGAGTAAVPSPIEMVFSYVMMPSRNWSEETRED